MLRVLAIAGAVVLLVAGALLAYIAVIAARRSEGVFLPAGYVAALCMAGGVLLFRMALTARG